MKILQERGIISFDEENYPDMTASFEVGWEYDSHGVGYKTQDIVIEFDGAKNGNFERISEKEYFKKSRTIKLNHILGDI